MTTKVDAQLLTGAITADSSGNVQINGASGTYKMNLADASNAFHGFKAGSNAAFVVGQDVNGDTYVLNLQNGTLRLGANNAEYIRIDPANSQVVVKQPAGLGYGSGAGGSVTQATSKATAVTLNKPCGLITMNAASLAASTTVTFQLNNSLIASTDCVVVTIADSVTTAGSYQAWASDTRAGYCQVNLRNMTAGARSESVILSFVVIKCATA